jgi:hypothetical protein
MRAVDWVWGNSTREVPTVQEMEKTVRELFEHALKNKERGDTSGYCSSGGFAVEINDIDIVFVEFILEAQSSEGNE